MSGILPIDVTKENIIPKSIQLIAGRTAREYNQRKNRKGAFWEDRYHATAVKTGNHLIRCLAYIDLNMVRAGVVRHPCEWMYGGYNEIQNPKQRYSQINRPKLTALLGIKDNDQLSEYHRNWVEEVLKNSSNQRDAKWTQSIAVGDKEFVMETKAKLGAKAKPEPKLHHRWLPVSILRHKAHRTQAMSRIQRSIF